MTTAEPTISPARRASRSSHDKDFRHIVHHQEPDGAIWYLCGIRRAAGTATIGAHRDKLLCPACEAAAHLLEAMP